MRGEMEKRYQNGDLTEGSELVPLSEVPEDKDIVVWSMETASSKETEIDADINDFIPSPPDGGWGWVICLASFMNHFILDGICYAFGSFMMDYSTYFKSSAGATSALMSTLIGCYMLSAPVASALINKYGCRAVGIAGSLLAASSFIICTLSREIEAMVFLFGVCGGIGFGLMYMPAVISVSLYFEKRRPIAVGIGMCGTGVGTFVFGPTSQYLLEHMDWKSAHFILAGIILHGAFFSALIRPLDTIHDKKVRAENRLKKQQQKALEKISEKPAVPDAKGLISERTGKPVTKVIMTSHPNMRTTHGSRTNVGSRMNVYHSTNRLGGVGSQKKMAQLSVEEAEDLKRPLYRKDIFYSGSVYHLPEYKETNNVDDYMASITSIPAMNEDSVAPKTFTCGCFPRQMADTLSEMLDFSLLKSGSFNLVAFLSMMIMLAYFIPFAFSSVRAETLGMESHKAAFLISILGGSTMIGRLISAALALIPNIRALIVHNLFLFLAGVSCACIPFCTDFLTMAISNFCYGMFMGGHIALSPIVLVDLIGLDKLTTAYGIITLVRGISVLMGPPLAGVLYDRFQSYDMAFYLAGGLIIISTVGFLLLELKCFKPKQKDSA